MAEHRILFPRDEESARDLEESCADERSNFEVETFSMLQKMEFLRQLTVSSPQFRPWNREPGRVISVAEIPVFLEALVAIRKRALDQGFGSLLDRIHAKALKSRDLGLPILLFR
jgi:hypothetical protein